MFNFNRIKKIIGAHAILDIKMSDFQEGQIEEIPLSTQEEDIIPQPIDLPVSHPSVPVPSEQRGREEILSRMDLWISMNRQEIAEEYQLDLIALINQKNQNPSESNLPPDPILFRALKEDPSLQQIFLQKLQEAGITNVNKASLFVETMMAKTEQLMEDINRRQQVGMEEETKEDDKERALMELLSEDPYAALVILPDNGLFETAFSSFIELPRYKQIELFGDVDLEENLAEALEIKLSPPKSPMHLDQRMNFFLHNPQYLQEILAENKFLNNTIVQQIGEENFPVSDSMEAIVKGRENKGKKRRLANILNNLIGDDLLDVLKRLAQQAHPDLARWIKPALYQMQTGKEQSYSDRGEVEEGYSKEQNLGYQAKPTSELSDSKINEADIQEAAEEVKSVIKYYFKDNLYDMHSLYAISIRSMLSSALEEYKKKKSSGNMSEYVRAESLNAFCKAMLQQLEALFKTKGKISRDKKSIKYQNLFGVISIPREVLKEIFGVGVRSKGGGEESEQQSKQDIENYKKYVEQYQRRMRDNEVTTPLELAWGKMVNYKIPFRAHANLGEIKSKIKELQTRGNNIDSIRKTLMSQERTANLMRQFCNINPDDSPSVAVQKINDFIYMTMEQSRSDIAHFLDAYEMKKRLDHLKEMKEQLSKSVSARSKREREQRLKEYEEEEKKLSEGIKNLKSRIGYQWLPMLGYLVRAVELGIVDRDSARIFASLFDHDSSKLKYFLKMGIRPNHNDPPQYRTNTELYYKLTGKPIPEVIQKLIEVYKDGITDRGPGKIPKIQHWYFVFFDQYWAMYEARYRKWKEEKEKLLAKTEAILEHPKKNRSRILSILDNEELYVSILNSIPNRSSRTRFQLDMEKFIMGEPVEFLPEYYDLLGMKGPAKSLRKLFQSREKSEEIIEEVKKEMEEAKDEMERMLREKGYDIDLDALKMAARKYFYLMKKISHLKIIKNSLYKFASIKHYSIEKTINKIYKEFDEYFNSLLA